MTARDDRRFGHLLRILGLAFGLAVVVGGVVGQGILRTPGIVAGAVPDPTLILALWALGGLLILIDACSLVELGASIPRAGGPYALAARAYGQTGGTVVGWADWMVSTLVIAFVSVVFGEYCHRLGMGQQLLAVSVPLTVATIAALDLAAIVMRRREPDLPRPFKMPWFRYPQLRDSRLTWSCWRRC